MRFLALLLAAVCTFFTMQLSAEARVKINVDLSSQTMRVSSATGDYVWPISSARAGFRTPRGTYGVKSLQAMHRSRKYHNAPMPHSIFFSGGYAIHGTYATGALGTPASHGCVRLAPGNAAALFQMVKAEGASISISGSSPAAETRVAARAERRHYAAAQRTRARPAYGYAYQYPYGSGYSYGTPAPGDQGGFFYAPRQALGYAPVRNPALYRWVADPTGD